MTAVAKSISLASSKAPAMKRSIANFLTSPNKVAQTLDWRFRAANMLTVSVSKNEVEVLITSHPAMGEPSVHHIEPIPLTKHVVNNKLIIDDKVSQELSDIIKKYDVGGMVVNWPVQQGGWCGSECGRVLHFLDSLVAASDKVHVLDIHRPVCLYDMNHNLPYEDEWGRNPLYAKLPPSDKTKFVANDKSTTATGTAALNVWNDFCKKHWPELCNAKHNVIGDFEYDDDDFEKVQFA